MNNKIKQLITLGVFSYFIIVALGLSSYNLYTGNLIPKFYPFANSTYLLDSTNYVKLNKGFYIWDSLYVGNTITVNNGYIYLDTNKAGQLYFNGYDANLVNTKQGGDLNLMINDNKGALNPQISIQKYQGSSYTILTTIDTSGLEVNTGKLFLNSPNTAIYLTGTKLVFKINSRYFYLDGTTTADQHLIYSATAP